MAALFNIWIEIEAMEDGDVDQTQSDYLTTEIDGAACYRTDDPDDAVSFANHLQQIAAAGVSTQAIIEMSQGTIEKVTFDSTPLDVVIIDWAADRAQQETQIAKVTDPRIRARLQRRNAH